MHPLVSNAELEIFKGLSSRGLTRGMTTQQLIILKATIPDFTWNEKRKAVYLDGEQVHRKKQDWDEAVVVMLEEKGWQVLRIPYSAPLTKEKLAEALDEIQEFIGESKEDEST
jgi:very-short-patch-repair endonuclease